MQNMFKIDLLKGKMMGSKFCGRLYGDMFGYKYIWVLTLINDVIIEAVSKPIILAVGLGNNALITKSKLDKPARLKY